MRAYRVLNVLAIVALVLTLVPLAAIAAPPVDGTLVYYVQWGDTLFSIARRFGTTVPAIMTANGLTTDYIFAGQRLVIPLGAPPAPPPPGYTCKYTVQARDTIYSIAWRYKVPYYTLMQANNLYTPYIRVGMQLNVPCTTPPPDPFPIYEVKGGDNLFRIAIQYKTSIAAIVLVNGLYSTHWIYPGQKLIIPYPNTVQYPPNIPTRVPSTAVPSPSPTVTASLSIVISNNAFIPPNPIVDRGSTVIWKNLDSTPHTVTSGTPGNITGVFRSGTLNKDQTYVFTFPITGSFPITYTYFSETSPTTTGIIVVR